MVGGTAPAVTVQTNSGVAILFTYSADVGRWQNWCTVFTILSLLSPLHPGCVSLHLAGLHSFTHSHAPYPAFYGSCVDVAGLHIMSAHILEVKHRTACWSGAYFKLTVVFSDSAILHATHVAGPSQATLAEESMHAWSVCQLEHLSTSVLGM